MGERLMFEVAVRLTYKQKHSREKLIDLIETRLSDSVQYVDGVDGRASVTCGGQELSLTDIRNGTGFPAGVKFLQLREG